MDDIQLENLLKKLESKKKDCITFSKKYEIRNMSELKQYYEGAKWAFEFVISELNDKK